MWCNWCGHELAKGEDERMQCPHCETIWCGDECCGVMPVYAESEIIYDKRKDRAVARERG